MMVMVVVVVVAYLLIHFSWYSFICLSECIYFSCGSRLDITVYNVQSVLTEQKCIKHSSRVLHFYVGLCFEEIGESKNGFLSPRKCLNVRCWLWNIQCNADIMPIWKEAKTRWMAREMCMEQDKGKKEWVAWVEF